MGGRYAVEREAADLLRVTLAGDLSNALVSACEAEVRAQLSVVRRGDVRVFVDLTEVVHYSIEARDGLVDVQQFIGRKASQTAYAQGGALGRSLSLWISHTSEEQVIRSFRNEELALGWLGGNEAPSTGVRPLAKTRTRGTGGRRQTG